LDSVIKEFDSRFNVIGGFMRDMEGKAIGDDEAKYVPVGQVVAEVGWRI
jgi:hypothetical protein